MPAYRRYLAIMIKLLKQWYLLLIHIQQRYVADGCSHSAAALTYMSLFALVPLMTVMYAMLSAVPAFQELGAQVQAFIFSNFVPTTGQEVQDYLQRFSEQARSLTGIGVVFLVVTALVMLKNIEKCFNGIWRTRENRKGLSSFLLYWAILSLGPLFIGLALAISTYLVSLKVVFDQVDVIGVGPYLLRISPYVLTGAAFTLLFAAVPNCRVPIKHALAGGFITALAFETAKQLFALVVANTSFQSIYGTFATVPLFLMWIYTSWLIVLAGAELVHALNGLSTQGQQPLSELTVSLALLELLWRRHQQAQPVTEHQLLRQPWLFNRYRLNAEQWAVIRDKLMQAKLLNITDTGQFILGRDLNHYNLWQLLQLLGNHIEETQQEQDSVPFWFEQCLQQLAAAQTHNRQLLSTPLAQLFSATKERDETTEGNETPMTISSIRNKGV